MKRATLSTSSGDVSKSGNPCERLIAPTSLARRVLTATMLTPPVGSFDRRVSSWDIHPIITVDVWSSALEPLGRLQRHERVLASQRHHPIVIPDFGDLLADQAVAQAPQLEAV